LDQFICGEITIADCVILPQLAKWQAGYVDYIPKDILDSYPVITAYLERIRAVPAVAAWYAK
jgi:glutathione S-transferase